MKKIARTEILRDGLRKEPVAGETKRSALQRTLLLANEHLFLVMRGGTGRQ